MLRELKCLSEAAFWPLAMTLWVLALPAGAAGLHPSNLAGTWAVRSGDRNVIVVSLHSGPSGDTVRGSLVAPSAISFDPGGGAIYGVRMPTRRMSIFASADDGDSVLLSASDNKDRSIVKLRIRLLSSGRSELTFDGLVMNPMPLERVGRTATVYRAWNPDVSYSLGGPAVSDPGMIAIYQADQADRFDKSLTLDDVRDHDTRRRTQVLEFIHSGRLHSGLDFEDAAYIFQHGSTPDDYLLSHSLALVAMKKGQAGAATIAAESLDRYLQSIGRPQIFGTQFHAIPGRQETSEEPFRPGLIPDVLRRDLGVETLRVQKAQRKLPCPRSPAMCGTSSAETSAP